MAEPEEDDAPGVPEWVVTYGDMMSLLLTFFIMLVSMSELKEDGGKVRAMLDAIREAFGPTSGMIAAPGRSLQKNSAKTKHASKGRRSEGESKKRSSNSEGASGALRTVQSLNHGTVVTMGGPTLFDATLPEMLKKNLDTIARVAGPKSNRLMVRGHALPEPLPPESAFQDQLELSFARARAAAEYLVEKGIDRRRLLVSAAGYAEPRSRTRQKQGQKLNRRVDVFLIDSYITRVPQTDSSNR